MRNNDHIHDMILICSPSSFCSPFYFGEFWTWLPRSHPE